MKMMSHKSPLLALLFLSLFSLLPLTHGHGGPMKNSYMPDAEKSQHFMAEWITYEVDEILWVNFTVKVTYNGWVAIGFTSADKENNYDYILGYVTEKIPVLDRYQKESTDEFDDDKTLGGEYSLSDVSTQYKDDILQMKFTRRLNTGDPFDYNLEQEGQLHIMWAYGKLDGEQIGAMQGTGTEVITFINEEMEDEEQQLKVHGIMMMLVVMVLMTSGVVLSRYLKLIFAWWFYAHTAIFCLAVFFVAVSTVIIFRAHDNIFVGGWHAVFGLFFIVGMGIQTVLGLLSHLLFNNKRTSPPVFPDKLHWYMGRSMFFLGSITVLLGLYVLPSRKLAKNAFYAWLVVIFFFVLALEKHIGQTHEAAAKGIAEDDEAFANDDEAEYVPKRGNSLSHGVVPRQYSNKFLFKLLCPAGFTIFILFVIVAIGINTTEL